MKKIILSLAAVLMIGLSAFAGKGGDDNERAIAAFSKDFSNAKNVVWQHNVGQTRDNLSRVTFSLNDQVLTAYYNDNGELQAVARNILSNQLPLSLLSDLKKNYNDYWISDLFEMASDDRTTYYVSLEDADKTVILRSNGTDGWSVFSKTKKEVE